MPAPSKSTVPAGWNWAELVVVPQQIAADVDRRRVFAAADRAQAVDFEIAGNRD